MARFTANEVDNYGGSGGAGYFRLTGDGDVARVRFLYTGIDDVEGYAVHRVQTGMGKNGKPVYKYINCLRDYNQPVDDCPFCREKMPQQAKIFIPVYNVDEDQIQTWDRGKTFFSKISSMCSRYKNLVSYVFEVERHGKSGEQTTTYEIYPAVDDETGDMIKDDTTIEDFDIPEILGKIVLDKSAEDMEYYLQEGQFPPEGEDVPIRRGNRHKDPEEQEEQEVPRRRTAGRRTPANRQDRF